MSDDGNTFNSVRTYTPPLSSDILTDTGDGLVAGTKYYFRIKAINEKGDSEWSN
jgi:hypothetical protein